MRAHRDTKSGRSEGRIAAALLAWYDRHRRQLPWRAAPGAACDPYAVWISEIMLQQTTVAATVPYYQRFIARWPTVAALAGADLDDVLHLWQGLGYYARARNLHRAARAIGATFAGKLPSSEAELRTLPGIGTYTAAAIAAIAFGRRAAAMDANAERVVARLFAVRDPLARVKAKLRMLAQALVPRDRPGDFAQALMDLGATVCQPSTPQCSVCPLRACCRAFARDLVAQVPLRVPKPPRPIRYGTAYWLSDGDTVLLRRRPHNGLLGGLMEVPMSAWSNTIASERETRAQAPRAARWRKLPGEVRHGFTHFELVLRVWAARAPASDVEQGIRWPLARLHEQALPSLVKKVIAFAWSRTRKRAAARSEQPPSSAATRKEAGGGHQRRHR